MDKAWVWLPRASLKYVQGATDFVTLSSRRLGNPAEMFCPCDQCRNVCYQPGEGNPQSANDSGGEYKDSDTIEETAFRKKLKDA
ncbi:unnamed protein product [Microthlaspi erraticum]|uniref:Transposase-associated domain-containing protein n=1 Tax=Microthlaspi erraticum TaxID=1685480 RepID=A0A6D2HVH2_9BRAS|nr:unnamed protein product [Microthlaspi erraticum]